MLQFRRAVLVHAAFAWLIVVALSQLVNAATSSTRLLNRAQAFLDQNQKYAALACLDKLISQEQHNALACKAYLCRADANRRLGQYQKQIDDLTSAIKINPKVADAFERRGFAYYELGLLQNAIDDCTTATSISPISPNAYSITAFAYEELGWYDKAIEARTKVLALDTKDAFEWFHRAKDYRLLGKFKLAQDDWQKATKLACPRERAEMQLESPFLDFKNPSGDRGNINKQLKSGSVVLSFHYDDGGHICVPVQVNGHLYQFMLDTGSAESDLWRKAICRVANVNEVQIQRTNAEGKKYLSRWFIARELRLGNITLSNVAMEVDEGLPNQKTLSGFLGGNILENFVVTIDYAKKQVTLAKSFERKSSNEAIIVPIMIRNHVPLCSARLDGRLHVMALLDTGCPNNMSADSLLGPVLGKKLYFYERTWGPWLGNLSVARVRLDKLELGALNLEEPIFVVFPAAEAPIAAKRITLGNSFLSGFKTVTFDYPAKQVLFEPAEVGFRSAATLYSEGRFYLGQGEMQRAVDAFTKSMNLDSDFALACYNYRATAFVNLKEYQKALKDATAAIRLDPKNASLYRVRAWVYEKLGEYRLQAADDTTAISLDPRFQFAYTNRAWAFDKLDKHGSVKRHRQKANQKQFS